MRLTKYQKARLTEFEWDVVQNKDGQNCSWLEVSPEDGIIFNEACKVLGLTGDADYVQMLIVGTKEINTGDNEDE
tara:strand:- start:1195 stop:1419 length:225 start_codon:yes stop_codon:yes gene_type:complete